MKKLLTAALAGAIAVTMTVPALALDNKAATPETSTETTGAINRVPLVAGENSFTESQARERIQAAGYTDVSGLKLDDQGIWRGKAVKSSAPVAVGLDFQGNVAAE
jgi:predicted transcriptional regulator